VRAELLAGRRVVASARWGHFCLRRGTSFQAWGQSAPGGPPPPGLLDAPVRKLIGLGAGVALGFAFVAAVVYSIVYLVGLEVFIIVTTR
jgi:hypothetical protein